MTIREIQLTAKQLVFVFMSTLLAAVVVFLLGVWVGRGIGVEPSVAGQELTGPIDAGTVASAKGAAPDAGKLSYPDLLQGSGKSAASPPPAPPVAESTPEAPPPAAPEPPKPAPTAPQTTPASVEGWFVQTNAYSAKASADREVATLKGLGYAAFATPGPLFRVRIGPYSDRPAAEKVATRLRGESKGFKPSVIPPR